jgi:hypothetical protein
MHPSLHRRRPQTRVLSSDFAPKMGFISCRWRCQALVVLVSLVLPSVCSAPHPAERLSKESSIVGSSGASRLITAAVERAALCPSPPCSRRIILGFSNYGYRKFALNWVRRPYRADHGSNRPRARCEPATAA